MGTRRGSGGVGDRGLAPRLGALSWAHCATSGLAPALHRTLYRGRAPGSGTSAGGQWAAPTLGGQHCAQGGNFAAVLGSPLPGARRVSPRGQRVTCPGQATQAAVYTGRAAGDPRMVRSRRFPRSSARCWSGTPGETSLRPGSPMDLQTAASARLLSLAAVSPLSPLGPWLRLLLFLLRPGHPYPAPAGVMRFPEARATQLPAARWRGREAGLGGAGRSGRR